MNSFCTLFDSNYLARALVMCRSLAQTGEQFMLYAVCFDERAHRVLAKLNLPEVVAIPLEAFETDQLRAVRSQRTPREYCWTCTPHVIRFVLDKWNLSQLTYLDADLRFYDKPSLLLAEMARVQASVLITPHRYTPEYDQSATSGIYCVQFVTFNRDSRGLEALAWWQLRCLEWCFARFEGGKFGDQKYLDDWPQRFEGVHVLEQVGGGVAPWNVQQYRLSVGSKQVQVGDAPLVFYHFHGYRYYSNGVHDFGSYRLSVDVVDLLYRPYAQELLSAQAQLQGVDGEFDFGWAVPDSSWRGFAGRLKRMLKGVSNRYRIV